MYYYMYYINYMNVLLTYIFKVELVNVSNSPRSDSIPNKNRYFNIINS